MTLAPNFTVSPDSLVISMMSARLILSSSSATRASIQPCCSLAAWYSAFSERSPCERASSIALMMRGRSTDFRCLISSIMAAWPAVGHRHFFHIASNIRQFKFVRAGQRPAPAVATFRSSEEPVPERAASRFPSGASAGQPIKMAERAENFKGDGEF